MKARCEMATEKHTSEKCLPGYEVLKISVFREENESFGIGIVPSYGETKYYYKVKRLLPNGACAKQCRRLNVGDILLECNNRSLQGLTQTQCIDTLKRSELKTILTILRGERDRALYYATDARAHSPLIGEGSNSFTTRYLSNKDLLQQVFRRPASSTCPIGQAEKDVQTTDNNLTTVDSHTILCNNHRSTSELHNLGLNVRTIKRDDDFTSDRRNPNRKSAINQSSSNFCHENNDKYKNLIDVPESSSSLEVNNENNKIISLELPEATGHVLSYNPYIESRHTGNSTFFPSSRESTSIYNIDSIEFQSAINNHVISKTVHEDKKFREKNSSVGFIETVSDDSFIQETNYLAASSEYIFPSESLTQDVLMDKCLQSRRNNTKGNELQCFPEITEIMLKTKSQFPSGKKAIHGDADVISDVENGRHDNLPTALANNTFCKPINNKCEVDNISSFDDNLSTDQVELCEINEFVIDSLKSNAPQHEKFVCDEEVEYHEIASVDGSAMTVSTNSEFGNVDIDISVMSDSTTRQSSLDCFMSLWSEGEQNNVEKEITTTTQDGSTPYTYDLEIPMSFEHSIVDNGYHNTRILSGNVTKENEGFHKGNSRLLSKNVEDKVSNLEDSFNKRTMLSHHESNPCCHENTATKTKAHDYCYFDQCRAVVCDASDAINTSNIKPIRRRFEIDEITSPVFVHRYCEPNMLHCVNSRNRRSIVRHTDPDAISTLIEEMMKLFPKRKDEKFQRSINNKREVIEEKILPSVCKKKRFSSLVRQNLIALDKRKDDHGMESSASDFVDNNISVESSVTHNCDMKVLNDDCFASSSNIGIYASNPYLVLDKHNSHDTKIVNECEAKKCDGEITINNCYAPKTMVMSTASSSEYAFAPFQHINDSSNLCNQVVALVDHTSDVSTESTFSNLSEICSSISGGNANVEYPKVEHQKMEHQQMEHPKVEHPKVEYPKVAHPKVEHQKVEHQKARSNSMPFQVEVVNGIVGVGIKVKSSDDGVVKITDIHSNGPVDKNGQVSHVSSIRLTCRIGDFLLSVNSSVLTGLPDNRVQQVLRLTPRGLVKLLISSNRPQVLPRSSIISTDTSRCSGFWTSVAQTDFDVRRGALPVSSTDVPSHTKTMQSLHSNANDVIMSSISALAVDINPHDSILGKDIIEVDHKMATRRLSKALSPRHSFEMTSVTGLVSNKSTTCNSSTVGYACMIYQNCEMHPVYSSAKPRCNTNDFETVLDSKTSQYHQNPKNNNHCTCIGNQAQSISSETQGTGLFTAPYQKRRAMSADLTNRRDARKSNKVVNDSTYDTDTCVSKTISHNMNKYRALCKKQLSVNPNSNLHGEHAVAEEQEIIPIWPENVKKNEKRVTLAPHVEPPVAPPVAPKPRVIGPEVYFQKGNNYPPVCETSGLKNKAFVDESTSLKKDAATVGHIDESYPTDCIPVTYASYNSDCCFAELGDSSGTVNKNNDKYKHSERQRDVVEKKQSNDISDEVSSEYLSCTKPGRIFSSSHQRRNNQRNVEHNTMPIAKNTSVTSKDKDLMKGDVFVYPTSDCQSSMLTGGAILTPTSASVSLQNSDPVILVSLCSTSQVTDYQVEKCNVESNKKQLALLSDESQDNFKSLTTTSEKSEDLTETSKTSDIWKHFDGGRRHESTMTEEEASKTFNSGNKTIDTRRRKMFFFDQMSDVIIKDAVQLNDDLKVAEHSDGCNPSKRKVSGKETTLKNSNGRESMLVNNINSANIISSDTQGNVYVEAKSFTYSGKNNEEKRFTYNVSDNVNATDILHPSNLQKIDAPLYTEKRLTTHHCCDEEIQSIALSIVDDVLRKAMIEYQRRESDFSPTESSFFVNVCDKPPPLPCIPPPSFILKSSFVASDDNKKVNGAIDEFTYGSKTVGHVDNLSHSTPGMTNNYCDRIQDINRNIIEINSSGIDNAYFDNDVVKSVNLVTCNYDAHNSIAKSVTCNTESRDKILENEVFDTHLTKQQKTPIVALVNAKTNSDNHDVLKINIPTETPDTSLPKTSRNSTSKYHGDDQNTAMTNEVDDELVFCLQKNGIYSIVQQPTTNDVMDDCKTNLKCIEQELPVVSNCSVVIYDNVFVGNNRIKCVEIEQSKSTKSLQIDRNIDNLKVGLNDVTENNNEDKSLQSDSTTYPDSETLTSQTVIVRNVVKHAKLKIKRRWHIFDKHGNDILHGDGNISTAISASVLRHVCHLSPDEFVSLISYLDCELDDVGLSADLEIRVMPMIGEDGELIQLDTRQRHDYFVQVVRVRASCLIQEGDLLLSINRKVQRHKRPAQVMAEMEKNRSSKIVLVTARDNSHDDNVDDCGRKITDSDPDNEEECDILHVTMMKGATGVGFCLEGGKSSPCGDLPILIKRIFKGGPAEKCGQLEAKDEILEVNGVDFTALRHYEAWNHLKFLDDGPVHFRIRRVPR